ncbi:MAG TPA: M56 family metallopeptidase [Candidatus Acidoferrum sp.]|nr:M56 family metallopeptidase [Candidatus Acidoferrum sp.]
MTSANFDQALAFLGDCSLKATLLLGAAWVLACALRRSSSALRHHLWVAAILASLALPFGISLLPVWHSPVLGQVVSIFGANHAAPARLIPPDPSAMSIHVHPVSSAALNWPLLILVLWAIGSFFIVFRLLAGYVRIAWISASSTPLLLDEWMAATLTISTSLRIRRPVRLLRARSALAMPLTWGFLRPVIVLPAGAGEWDLHRRDIVLTHELAHIARHDWILQILAEFTRALYWFHPLVWLAVLRLRQESECACDDAVLRTGIAPAVYASQLLDLARNMENRARVWATAVAIARPTNLERRFSAMLNPAVNRTRLSVKARYLVPVLALFCLLPLAALRLPAQNLAGKTSGTIHDPSGSPLANATIVMTNHSVNTIDMTTTDRSGNFSFSALPAGAYELEVYKPGFATLRKPDLTLEPGQDFSANFTLDIGAITEHVTVVPSDSERPVVTARTDGKPSRLGIGGGVEAAKLLTRVQPKYPETAKSAGVQGTVVLHAVIGKEGKPLSLRVMNSEIDPSLARSAVEAVSQWRYTPTLLNGEPVEVDTTITVNYSLQE